MEYEKFAQEVYQKLVNADVVKSTEVRHDIRILGKSGQKHQIDVYWEYEIAGVLHKVYLANLDTTFLCNLIYPTFVVLVVYRH